MTTLIELFGQFAPYLSNPFVLSGFFGVLIFGIVWALIEAKVLRLPRGAGLDIVTRALRYAFLLALVSILAGVLQKILEERDQKTVQAADNDPDPVVDLMLTADNGIALENSGGGLATIQTFNMSLDGKAVKDWADLLVGIGAYKEVAAGLNSTMPKGSSQTIMRIVGGIGELQENAERIAFEFCYCSEDGRSCWRKLWQNGNQNAIQVASCPPTPPVNTGITGAP